MPKKDTRARGRSDVAFAVEVFFRVFFSWMCAICVCVNSHDDGLKKARNTVPSLARNEPARRRGICADVRTASGVRDAVDEDGDADSDTV